MSSKRVLIPIDARAKSPRLLAVVVIGVTTFLGPSSSPAKSFYAFESGPVRPISLSADGSRLFAVNTPDNRLEVFDTAGGSLRAVGSVAVGLEPVALAVRGGDVWVVNHLSDSVSIVDVASLRVKRTLLVGDEPRDIVFAGPDRRRAFIATAHRGQHRTDPSLSGVDGAGDPQLATPGVGRADVWVFDADSTGAGLGGRPLRVLTLFGDTPRALATSADGATVYLAVFQSGNQTTTIPEGAVCDGFAAAPPCVVDGATMPGGNPGPDRNRAGAPAPEVGLIVRRDPTTGKWLDEVGRDWQAAVRFELPDYDIFAIDASSLEEKRAERVAHVGTTLFNLAVNPQSGALYVSNTEARNEVRFEGSGEFGGSTVLGHLAEARVSVVRGTVAQSRALNKHIDYSVHVAPATTKRHSLATPTAMVVSADGGMLYVAAFGSSRVGVFPTATLEDNSFDPTALSSGYLRTRGGPAGLALDETTRRLFVYARFDNSVSIIDLDSGNEVAHVTMFNPEPTHVVSGRRFLYDAEYTSSNGEASCASCHVFGDVDHLAWDLGDPDGDLSVSPIDIKLAAAAGSEINGTGRASDFHPMKGPMTTQTLRGLRFSGAQHWRGDRATGVYGTAAKDADLSFRNFNPAFVGLVGRESQLSDPEMQLFADFALELTMPPNPVRALDNSLGVSAQRGLDFYTGDRFSDGVAIPGLGFNCNGCHTLDPAQGFFGTNGDQSFEAEPQIIKVPQLRNLYQKVGMFGMLAVPFVNSGNNGPQGPQIRGFGFLHDGSIDTLFRFFNARVFDEDGMVGFNGGDSQRNDVVALMMAFDSDLAPVVGQQVTLRSDNAGEVGPRIDLLLARASTPFVSRLVGQGRNECDLVARVRVAGRVRGYLWREERFVPDDGGGALRDTELRNLARNSGQEITYTCVPPGAGERIGLDRDSDGVYDGVDNCPLLANVDQRDTDGDSVGDACDPRTVPPHDATVGSQPDAGMPPPGGVDAGTTKGSGGGGCELGLGASRGGAGLWLLLLVWLCLRRREWVTVRRRQ